jgi:hypothetical protein
MSLFKKKQEVYLETVCRIFYDNVILDCVVDGRDINAAIFDILRNALVATDNNFASVEPQKFNNEIVVLQFELFGLAWLHQFGDKSAILQSTFTKNYLQEKKRDDIWDAMEPYNQAIARSSTLGRTSKNAFDRPYLARVMLTRANSFDKFHQEGYDPKSIARALNRLFADDVWRKGTTAGLLLFALCDRLGFNPDFKPSKEAQSRWFIEINDFYDKTKQSLRNMKIKS